MHKTLFSFLLILSFGNLISQNNMSGGIAIIDEDYITTSSQRYSITSDRYLPDDVVGSPYVEEVFQPGVLFEKEQSPIKGLYFRYNSYEDDIEVKKHMNDEDKDILLINNSPDILVKIASDLFVFDESINGYFQVLFQGNNFKLYKRFNKKRHPAKRAVNSFDRDVLETFEDKPTYFMLSNSEGIFHEIPSSKRKRIKFFGNKQIEINKYVTKYKLDITDQNILIKIVRYFDSFKDASLK